MRFFLSLCLVAFFSSFHVSAFADVSYHTGYVCTADSKSGSGDSAAAACSALVAVIQGSSRGNPVQVDVNCSYQYTFSTPMDGWIWRSAHYFANSGRTCTTTDSPAAKWTQYSLSSSNYCPANSAENAGKSGCTCLINYVEDVSHSQCVLPTCNQNEVSDAGYYDVGTSLSASPLIFACKSGCVVQFDGVSPAGSAMVGGVKHYFAQGGYYNNGDKCAQSSIEGLQQLSSGSSSIPEDTCKVGQYPGYVNGQFVCADGSGNVVKPDAPAPSASSSSGSTTSVTANPDGTTTTTTTTTNTDGSGNSNTTVVTRTCDQSGNCSSTSKTTGDKTDDQKSECELHPNSAGCTSLGTAPSSESATKWSVPMSITPTSGWDHDASCPADHVISLSLLGSIALPWGLLCTAADYARPVIIAVAWLSAVFSFFGISRRGAE